MTTTPESNSAHVTPVFANSLSRIACGRSHTMPVPADNTRIISIHSDVILAVNPDMTSCCGWPNLRGLPPSFRIPTACTVRGTRGSPVFPAPGLLTSPSKCLCRLTVISCRGCDGHYMSFFGSRSWLFVPVSRVFFTGKGHVVGSRYLLVSLQEELA